MTGGLAKDGAQAALVETLQLPYQLPIGNPGLCTISGGRIDDGSVYQDLCREAGVFHCVQFDDIDADMRRAVRLSWRGLVHYLSFLQADGKAEVLGCIREI